MYASVRRATLVNGRNVLKEEVKVAPENMGRIVAGQKQFVDSNLRCQVDAPRVLGADGLSASINHCETIVVAWGLRGNTEMEQLLPSQ